MALRGIHMLPVYAGIAIGIVATAITVVSVNRLSVDEARGEFTARTMDYHRTVEISLRDRLSLLDTLRGLYAASNFVSEQEFLDFVDAVLPPGDGLHSIIWVPDTDVPTSFPVGYVRTAGKNDLLTGQDLGASPGYKAFFAKAVSNPGQLIFASTDPHFPALAQEQTDFQVIIPFYKQQKVKGAVGKTDMSLTGYILGVFILDEWIGHIIEVSGISSVEMSITHKGDSGEDSVLFSNISSQSASPGHKAAAVSDFQTVLPIRLADQQWDVTYHPAPGEFRPSWIGSLLFGIVGLVLTLLLAAYLYSRILVQRRIRLKVIKRTRELSTANNMLRRQAFVMEQLRDAVIIATLGKEDGTREIIDCNPAAEKMYGFTRKEMIRKNPIELFQLKSIDDTREFHEAVAKVAETLSWSGEAKFVHKDGSKRLAAITVAPFYDKKGEKLGHFSVSHDITERRATEERQRELEQELSQIQKMESLGTLAGGIAHEINTPVQYVSDNTRFLRDSFGDFSGMIEKYQALTERASKIPDLASQARKILEEAEQADLDFILREVPDSIEQSLDGLKHIGAIVLAIKEFSHPDSKVKSATNINHAIANTITVASNQWKYVADLKTDFDDSLPLIPCFAGELNQVILNLIVNAAHAIEEASPAEKGTITISTSLKGGQAVIAISDTGTGIPKESQKRIFDPFFTTKEPGKGTGQGLSISHTIITKKHGGSLKVDSEMGVGTCFTISLPITDETGGQAGVAENAEMKEKSLV